MIAAPNGRGVMSRAERILVVLLRTIAAVDSLAIVAVFMPHAWMDAAHRWLGLGTLPDTPIIVYLTRSLSAMYAFHAGLLWMASRDVRHYAALITYVALACVVFGTVLVGIDLRAGLPGFWVAGEGPFFIGVGSAVLALQRGIAPAREQGHAG
jgi:hypothetical protein